MRFVPGVVLLTLVTLFLAVGTPKAQAQEFPSGAAQEQDWMAPGLQEWKDWILYDHPDMACTPSYDNSLSRICAFSHGLTLNALEKSLYFTQEWNVQAESRVALPYAPNLSGITGAWPENVYVDGETAPVADGGGVPTVMLPPGSHTIRGKLSWSAMPEFIMIPPNSGLLSLTINGEEEPFPRLGPDGRLDLAKRMVEEERPEDVFDVTIFRLVRDAIPMEITTLVRLDVSGKARKLSLENVLPKGPGGEPSTPLSVDSPVAISFGPDGGLNVQAGPGRWNIFIRSRLPGQVDSLGPAPAPYGIEFWSFQAQEDLRVVELTGAPAVDPQTTDIPDKWKSFPAYLVEAGASLAFNELHRGEPVAMPDRLSIERTLWLDFDGSGVTSVDDLYGRVRESQSLTMQGPGALGRVVLDGEDQPIVLLGEEDRAGVVLRSGQLNMRAESRYEDFDGSLPVTGWDREFEGVRAVLQLPPGWTLLAATGVDSVQESWFSRWDLMDIFMLLILSLAAFKLGRPLAALGLFAFLGLSFHEPGAPLWSWAGLLVALGLLTIFARRESFKGRLRVLLMAVFGLAAFVVIAWSIPFIFQQVRWGLHPQLEDRWSDTLSYMPTMPGTGVMAPPMADEGYYNEPSPQVLAREESEMDGSFSRDSFLDSAPDDYLQRDKEYNVQKQPAEKALMFDPEALVQTGPGVPDWNWRGVALTWDGSVTREQAMNLYLLSPLKTMLLRFARAALLLCALLPLVDIRRYLDGSGKAGKAPGKTATAAGLVLAAGLAMSATLGLGSPSPAQAAEYPPQELLETMRARLLTPAECFPYCYSSPGFELAVDGDELRYTMSVHAATDLALPLPRISERWQPTSVVLDGVAATLLFRRDGDLWLAVDKGVHEVVVTGQAPRGLSFQVDFPVKPKHGEVDAPGWSSSGLGRDGRIEGAIQLSREQTETTEQPEERYTIPPYLMVSRELVLGLTWECVTTVERKTPLGEPAVFRIPLLEGESVMSEGFEVEDGHVVVNLRPDQQSVTWRGRLDIAPSITLSAPENVDWVEAWRLEASSIWDVGTGGIPAVASLDEYDQWRPVWRPWPGESVTITVDRPEAAPGESLTIDKVDYAMEPGELLDRHILDMSIRASRGHRHTITLPEDAELLSLSVDGRELPRTGATPGEITIPISPGAQNVSVEWRSGRDSEMFLTPPEVGLGSSAVNVDLSLTVPQDRWILGVYGGPLLGPAVRFWPYLAGLMVAAFLLGLYPWSPLKRWQWFLLGLGLSQVNPIVALFAVLWLLALGLKREHHPREGWFWFDSVQLALGVLILIGVICLYQAIHTGLLGKPSMQIAGNGSYGYNLYWTQDRVSGQLPMPVVLTVPLYVYRLFMLAWSFWLAWTLLRVFNWTWDSLNAGGLLRAPSFGRRNKALPAQPEGAVQHPEDFDLGGTPEEKKE